jgi:uncharacterized protein (DUF2461 family)
VTVTPGRYNEETVKTFSVARCAHARLSRISQGSFDLLPDLKKHNNKEWFEPRKEIYETKAKAPMIALVEALNSELGKIAPNHVADPKKASTGSTGCPLQ